MQSLDPHATRPKLVNAALLARVLDALRPEVSCATEMWRVLTDRYVVDLDAAAALLPADESNTVWLTPRN